MTALWQSVYIEINIFCILILLYILQHQEKNDSQWSVNRSFQQANEVLLTLAFTDSLGLLLNGNTELPGARFLNYVNNDFYFIGIGFLDYCWLIYCMERLGIIHDQKDAKDILFKVPLIIFASFILISDGTGWIFRIDQANVYQRGPLFLPLIMLPYIYNVMTYTDLIHAIRHTESSPLRQEYLELFALSLIPLAGSILTMLIPDQPFMVPSATLSLLFIYMNYQSHAISTDSLTQINNRRQLDKSLAALTEDPPEKGWVTLLLLDIDAFKSINDTYGHHTGDRALIETAGLLRKACHEEKAFLARYGGDEFAILFVDRDNMEERLVTRISQIFEARNRDTREPYMLQMSVGAGRFGKGYAETIPALIDMADQQMYAQKKKKADRKAR